MRDLSQFAGTVVESVDHFTHRMDRLQGGLVPEKESKSVFRFQQMHTHNSDTTLTSQSPEQAYTEKLAHVTYIVNKKNHRIQIGIKIRIKSIKTETYVESAGSIS